MHGYPKEQHACETDDVYAKGTASAAFGSGYQSGVGASLNGNVTLTLPVDAAKALLRQVRVASHISRAMNDGPCVPYEHAVLSQIEHALQAVFS